MTIYEDVIAMTKSGKIPVFSVDEDFFEYLEESSVALEADLSEFAEAWSEWLKQECE